MVFFDLEFVEMANPGTFEKCRKQIEGAIKRRQKAGEKFAAMDLPYFAASDKKSTEDYVAELLSRGFTVERTHIDSSFYGRVYW